MLTNIYVPLIYDGSGNNGNWELSMIEGMMGIGVFTENADLLDHAMLFWHQRVPAYFYYFPIDGPQPQPLPRDTGRTTWNGQTVFDESVNGVAQETCRDFKHTEHGISATMAAAETAHIQGFDLYESEEPRLIAGLEFSSYYELGSPVPSSVCGGHITLGKGSTFVIGYNHYGNRLGLPLPNTLQWIIQGVLPQTLPTDVGGHMTIFEPLTHYADAGSNTPQPNFSLSASPSSQSIRLAPSMGWSPEHPQANERGNEFCTID